MKRGLWVLWIAVAAVTGACKGGDRQDPILALSAVESLEQGKSWLEKEKYFKARRYLTHAFEVAPNTAIGREALLLAADTFYLQGGEANLVQAEAKYRDYLNRFPTSDVAPYVQFQLGNCLAGRSKRADRDQTSTEKALAAYEEVLRLYPTSEYAARAREEIRNVRNQLAEHEYLVGKFYLNYGIYVASVSRFKGLLETYPEFREKEKVYLDLGRAYLKAGNELEALAIFTRMRREFPESPLLKEVPEVEFEEPQEAAGDGTAPAGPEPEPQEQEREQEQG